MKTIIHNVLVYFSKTDTKSLSSTSVSISSPCLTELKIHQTIKKYDR